MKKLIIVFILLFFILWFQSSSQMEISKETDAVNLTDLNLYDNTPISWGYSSKHVDTLNRPIDTVKANEKYNRFGAFYVLGSKENEKNICLTFDCGYENGITPSILDTLKEKNIKAVFFVTLPYVKQAPQLIERMIKEGHVIGNHSVTHPQKGMPSLSLTKQVSEIHTLHDYMQANFGYEMTLFRFPCGIFSEQSLALCNTLGYKSIFWSFAYRDWVTTDQPDTGLSLKKLTDSLHPGAIYLLHAVSKTNATILGSFIENATRMGYEFTLP